jgi:hypothetical protein
MGPESSKAIPRGYRFQAGLPAALADGGVERSCTAYNLSRTGVLLVGELPRPVAADVEFRIRTLAGDLERRFVGKIVRVESGDEPGETRLAVEFLDLDPEQKAALEVLLARVMEGMAPAPLESLRPGAPPHEVRKALDAVPLAQRIALASRAGPRERELLRQDPHPLVLESLARNPNLLLPEARALATVLHLLQSTLEILASDQRWAKDDEIRILIATHPHVPVPLAERLAGEVGKLALRKMLARPSLNEILRSKIVKKLARG